MVEPGSGMVCIDGESVISCGDQVDAGITCAMTAMAI